MFRFAPHNFVNFVHAAAPPSGIAGPFICTQTDPTVASLNFYFYFLFFIFFTAA
jgi:hypothetical protein